MLLSQSVRVVGVVRVVSEICFLIFHKCSYASLVSFFKFSKTPLHTRTDRTLLIVSGFDKREEKDTGSISLLPLLLRAIRFFISQARHGSHTPTAKVAIAYQGTTHSTL